MNSLESCWREMLTKIRDEGHDVKKDDLEIREYLGLHIFLPNVMLEKGFAFSHPARKFVSWIEGGAFDIGDYPIKGEALADYVDSINDEDKIYPGDKGFVYTYPERLKALWICDDDGAPSFVDQIDVICRRLEENAGSNRALAVIYQAGLDNAREDIPCLQVVQAFIRGDILYLSVFFRSNDIYGAWPSNMLFLTHIGLIIQERMEKTMPNLMFGGIDYHVSSAHYYQTDGDAVERVLE